MKVFFILAVLASFCLAQYDFYSQPFRLILNSSNSTINGTALGACHQGAATEGLCVTNETTTSPPTPYTSFYYATSQPSSSSGATDETGGIIYYNLTISGGTEVPSALRLVQDVNTNVALPIFLPGNTTYTAIYIENGSGELYIPRYLDDTVSPPAYLDATQKVKSWFVCLTTYGYTYETLAWKVGVQGEPQNPSCEEVTVARVFT